MSYTSPYKTFIFEDYSFDDKTKTAAFHYSFDGKRKFTERVSFHDDSKDQKTYNKEVLDKALQLAFIVAGTSYYKTFPTTQVQFKKGGLDNWQAEFAQIVYTDGLSQFMFENKLTRKNMPIFPVNDEESSDSASYHGEGIMALQSGGKDSLLLATLLEEQVVPYSAWYIGSSKSYPEVLDTLSGPLQLAERVIDTKALKQAANDQGLNGHVPVTYIVLSYALIETILQNKSTVLVSIGAEGGEAHEHIGDLNVNHQWSKTWEAETMFVNYVSTYISPNIRVGSPLRGCSELRIAELFVHRAWQKYGDSFSSCNRANYQQGAQNKNLTWCGECPKCANSFLLFAPFVQPEALQKLFNRQNLLKKPGLIETFKGLLGIENVMKPFECIGEVDELRLAYHMAVKKYGPEYELPFEVPASSFDYLKQHEVQPWVRSIITTV